VYGARDLLGRDPLLIRPGAAGASAPTGAGAREDGGPA
jgi:hypothetical protein